MADSKQLAILKKAVHAWNQWRKSNPSPSWIDLSGADLNGADLSGADLSGADLSGANLGGANLNGAHLRGTHLSHADLSGADLSGADLGWAELGGAELGEAHLSGANLSGAHLLRGTHLSHADLSGADLSGADLSGANLSAAHLRGTHLSGADLSGAHLTHADLGLAELGGAHLRGTHLSHADLTGTRLSHADLSGADLSGANLSGARLSHADLTGAALFATTVGDVDLSQAKGLSEVRHRGPSTIGIDTIYRSKGEISEAFLRGAGVPDNFITFARSLVYKAIEFYSCFISYSSKDQGFAERLHADLQAKGVRCWFAPEDVRGGKKLHEQIDEAIRVHDKLLLVLSEASMNSEWVATEITRARRRELRDQRRMLFPISLVPFDRIREWESFDADTGKDSAREVREYFIPDFSTWKDHDSYEKALTRVLRDLAQK